MWHRMQSVAGLLATFLAGGWVALAYLNMRLDHVLPEISRLEQKVSLCALFALSMYSIVSLKTGEKAAPLQEPSPAWSGGGVVVATGWAAAYYLGRDFREASDLIPSALILIATAAVAVAVVRFARRNADQIGEARVRKS